MSKLTDGIKELGFFTEDKVKYLEEKFDAYINEIKLFNQTANLVGTDDYDELSVHHVLDCLSGVKIFSEIAEKEQAKKGETRLVIGDIGSGSGFPGLVLATCFPDYDFQLIERMKKRCGFLESTVAVLGLKNVTVINKDAEKIKKKSLDIATFRAFRPLTLEMTKTILAMLKIDGVVIAYKARSEKIAEEMEGIKEIVSSFEKKSLTVPFLTKDTQEPRERNLVIFRKSSS